MAKNEEIEIDTEDKAKQIGKNMGISKDKDPEDEEDYEIEVEEEDDRKLGKNSERDEENKSADEKRADREKLSNREKRHLRNKKRFEKFAEKDAEIERLRVENDEMKRWKAQTDNRLHGISKSEVERAFNDSQQRFRHAEQESLAAFSESDGPRHLRAIQAMKEEDDRMKALRGAYAQINQNEPKQEQQQERQQHDPRVVTYAKKWAGKNDWYDPNGGDEESAIAKAVAGVLVNEGWDPTSKDYWDELDSRLEERLDKKSKNEDEEDNDDDFEEEDVVPKKKRRTSPPVNGGSKRSDSINGKKTIRLPTTYIEKMKREAPEIWNNPVRRAKLLKERERILREAE